MSNVMFAAAPVAFAQAMMVFHPDPAEAGQEIEVPSGQRVTWVDAIHDAQGSEGNAMRFRFLAPSISGRKPIDSEAALADIAWLCENFALARIPNIGPQVNQIVVSLMDQEIPFGEADDTVTQYFDAFNITNGTCELELFYD
ncbi:DUF6497 family protein [Albirhodobacter sp. R86504]|jgi:hypothetical protein|uniref:DUF6497 family protein n=1 Tax=Albirhodobacter sp. R86504 TaxID=3093848 RepID=UPI00366B0700